jgi:Tfp pilus assembly protein PilV
MAMVALLVVSLMATAIFQALVASHRQAKRYAHQVQAQWLAAAGAERALAQLARQPGYQGETWQAPLAPAGAAGGGEPDFGQVTITVEPTSPRKIVVQAVYPIDEHQRVLVRRELAPPTPDS